MERLKAFYWPGNVRELEKVVKRAVILADDGASASKRPTTGTAATRATSGRPPRTSYSPAHTPTVC